MQPPVLVGYSGHAFVVLSALASRGIIAEYYLDRERKEHNPFGLKYQGKEESPDGESVLMRHPYFIGIGDNQLRSRIDKAIYGRLYKAVIHVTAIVDPMAEVADGVFIGPGAIVNPLATVGRCAIVNSRAIVEHECRVGEYAHIAPGAVLLGNVSVGARTLIGGNAVVLPGVVIGADCTVGAGSVVLHDLPDGSVVAGNPARPL